MLRTFNTLIRPTLEYAVPTFHPMLNIEQSNAIEQIQKRASKIIFGWGTNYSELLESGRMESLKSRREKLTLSFAKKASSSDRFGAWFKKREYGEVNIRDKKLYEEQYARTDRLKNSPLFYMRRQLNNE